MPANPGERYRALIEYDGTDLHGFQRQATGRTVQGELEAALTRIGWTGRAVLGAGRTDSGVHASGQVIAFDLDWPHGPDHLLRALNANLPSDVAVKAVEACAPDFHPRYAARGRRYRYTLYNHPVRSPLAARYSWQVWPALDAAALQLASAALLGRHDFAAFGTDPDQGTNTVRTVAQADWQAAAGGWHTFEIQAEAFLYRMVRSLVGALKRVGQGEWTVAQFEALLASADRAQCPPLAPPQGLCLIEVLY
jgi:tRNA pseudouridine38-40 synthase